MNIKATLLWTNSSPNQNFSPQSVNPTGFSNYKYIIVTFKGHVSYPNTDSWIMKVERASGGYSSHPWVYIDSNFYCWIRNYVCMSDGIDFGDATSYNTSTGVSIENDRMIPIHIYGTNLL